MTILSLLKAYGWPLLSVLLAAWAFTECSTRRQAEAALEVERTLSESRATLDRSISQARAVAAAERAGVEAARAVVEAVARAEESAAAVDVGRAEAEERAIDEEFRATGRVTEAARKSWERWRSRAAPDAP